MGLILSTYTYRRSGIEYVALTVQRFDRSQKPVYTPDSSVQLASALSTNGVPLFPCVCAGACTLGHLNPEDEGL